MSSLHNDLDTWASKARSRGQDRIEILNTTAHRIASDLRELSRLREAFGLALIGGNHLANILIGKLGAGFADRYPHDMDHETALRSICATDEYEAWCCWSALMRAREMTEVSA